MPQKCMFLNTYKNEVGHLRYYFDMMVKFGDEIFQTILIC